MVSVKRCTLPDSYVEAAHKLIEALEHDYKIDYAFWYLRYSDDEEWYDGYWELIIVTDDLKHDSDGIRVIFNIIESLNIDLDEFNHSFTIKSNLGEWWYYLDKVIIKDYNGK